MILQSVQARQNPVFRSPERLAFSGRRHFQIKPSTQDLLAFKSKDLQSVDRLVGSLSQSLQTGTFEFNEAWPDRIRLMPDAIETLNGLLQSGSLPSKSREVISSLFEQHLARLLNQFQSGKAKMDADDLQGLWSLNPKLLTPTQRNATGQVIAHYIQSRWQVENPGFQRPGDQMLFRLKELAAPYGRKHLVERLETYKPIQITNGVKHVLLGERQGPPLREVYIASYNLEHFAIHKLKTFQRNRGIPGFKKNSNGQPAEKPPALNLLALDRFSDTGWYKQLGAMMASLRKVTRLGDVIRQKPEHEKFPDVIVFQEVKNIEYLRSFLTLNGLDEQYPNVLFYPPVRGDDGLAIVTSSAVRPHHPNRVNANAPRPSAEITLDLGDGKEMTLFNTHFKADNWKNNRMVVYQEGMRLNEAAAIGDRIGQLESRRPGACYAVLGDFNTDAQSNMKLFQNALGLEPVPLPAKPTHKNGFLDRVFISPNLTPSEIEVVGELDSVPPPPSDHLMMRLKLKVS